MYSFLHNLLSDKKDGEIFTLFGIWHFLYIGLTLFTVIVVLLCFKNKSADLKQKATRLFINMAFGLYILDIFLMPLAYGEIDIEKLPFHACTAMCLMCFLSHHSRFLEKYRLSFVLLGFISNFVYLVYPAGVMWHAVHPLSYRVIQTLLFHSVMTVYGLLVLIFECEKFNLKKWYRDLSVIVCMTLWSILGNSVYNGTSDGYSHFFNWFFVVRDPFYAIPESVSPFIMPFLNIALFFTAEIIICLILRGIRGIKVYDK
ncbi:MAG: YwaF family protein [Clostridia bacterium]|nr:YwaF family protein [Clostridia bacterium]